jgi:hypothetical protein
MRFLPVLRLAAPLACALIAAAPAFAQATNLGFEMGDLTGWTWNGNGEANANPADRAPAQGSSPTFSPHGQFYGYVTAGENMDPATLSQTLYLSAGDRLSGLAGFSNLDGYYADLDAFFNDSAYVKVNDTIVLSWDGLTVGGFANSGWDPFSFTADSAGYYRLEIGVRNGGDGNVPSSVLLDSVRVSGVPEAATWAMMVLGFGLAGAALRTRRRAISFG